MDEVKVKELLLWIGNNPYDNEEEIDEVFVEWRRQNERIAELEAQVERMPWRDPDKESPPKDREFLAEVTLLTDWMIVLKWSEIRNIWLSTEGHIEAYLHMIRRWKYLD